MRKNIINLFLIFCCISFLLTVIGIVVVWVRGSLNKLPYLDLLVGLTMVETAGVVIGIARGDVKLNNEESGKILNCKTQKQINSFMKNFISRGSRIDIFSGSLSWVAEDGDIKDFLIEKSYACEVNVFLPRLNDIAQELKDNGVNVYEYHEIEYIPRARFTLLNRGRPGAEVLAISNGTLPKHRIVEYEASNSPMLIAAASDLVAIVEKFRQ